MPDIFLYAGEANPNDIKLRDPLTTGSTNYVLSCAVGTYNVVGNDVTLKRNYNLIAGQGTYNVTGNDTGLKRGYYLGALQGTYLITGNAVTLKRNYNLTAEQGAYVISGNSALLTYTPFASSASYWNGNLYSDKHPYRTYGSAQQNQLKVYPQP